MALSPVAAGILPAVEPGVPPGGLVGTPAETTSARPRWALLRHDRAAGCRPPRQPGRLPLPRTWPVNRGQCRDTPGNGGHQWFQLGASFGPQSRTVVSLQTLRSLGFLPLRPAVPEVLQDADAAPCRPGPLTRRRLLHREICSASSRLCVKSGRLPHRPGACRFLPRAQSPEPKASLFGPTPRAPRLSVPILPRRCPGQHPPFLFVSKALPPFVRLALPLFPRA